MQEALVQLEAAKRAAVAAEDFDQAHALKLQIHKLSSSASGAVRSAAQQPGCWCGWAAGCGLLLAA